MEILEAKLEDLESFFEYLDTQLVENAASDSPLFQPISKEHSYVSDDLRAKFRNGFEVKLGQVGWRKLWLVKDLNQNIRGHIDLRHYSGGYNHHRVMLGVGVDANVRKQGIGVKLIETAVLFCKSNLSIDWLDLNVLSNNMPAKKLYLKCGFGIVGEMSDFYRIDGVSVSEITMTLSTKPDSK